MRKRLMAALVCCLAIHPNAHARVQPFASQETSQQIPPVIRAEANLVLLRFHVIRDNYYVGDLLPENIQILEDGRPRQVALFEGPTSVQRTIPVELVLLLDVSFSVTHRGLLNGTLLKDTVLAGLDEHARISIYGHAQRLRRFCEPTRDVSVLTRALSEAQRFEHLGTRLYRAIEQVCRDLGRSADNVLRAMIVFSDGFETGRGRPEDAARAAGQLDIKLFPVVLGHEQLLRRARTAAGPTGLRGARPEMGPAHSGDRLYYLEREMENFAALGESTGGRSFDPLSLNPETIRAILENVAADVRFEYVAGYYAEGSAAKGKRKVKVVLTNKSVGKIHGGEKEIRY